MTQEEKDLLLKDLCSRIPYGVKFVIDNGQNNVRTLTGIDEAIPYEDWQMCVFARGISAIPIEDIKPYLFPISSMTEEQKEELDNMFNQEDNVCEKIKTDNFDFSFYRKSIFDFLNKHHLDWRGLIPMGLAIDATNLNIY